MTKNLITIQPPIIAHRGASQLAPENTLAAFRKAKEIGAAWVEFDVVLTRDGTAIIMHDETLDRTTNGKGKVADVTYDYVKTLDAGSWFSPAFTGEKIPTLLEVIHLLNELQLGANIEIKPCLGVEEQTVKTVLDLVAHHWQQKNPPLFASFSQKVLTTLRQLSPDSLLAFLMHEWQPDWLVEATRLHCASVHVNQAVLTPEYAAKIKAENFYLFSYTVDDVIMARKLFSMGVDAIFSNCPDFKALELAAWR